MSQRDLYTEIERMGKDGVVVRAATDQFLDSLGVVRGEDVPQGDDSVFLLLLASLLNPLRYEVLKKTESLRPWLGNAASGRSVPELVELFLDKVGSAPRESGAPSSTSVRLAADALAKAVFLCVETREMKDREALSQLEIDD